MPEVMLIARDACFSPHSEEKDRAIIHAVAERLRLRGHSVTRIAEDAHATALRQWEKAELHCWLSMGRHTATLDFLRQQEQAGMMVVNSTQGVSLCKQRDRMEALMRRIGIPMPPSVQEEQTAEGGCWIKRADTTSQVPADVCFAATDGERLEALDAFRQRGITRVVVSSHVTGDVVKFYGVQPAGFFRVYYPTDDGDTKYDDERRNGPAHHYPFNQQRLQTEAQRLACVAGVPIYGGDAVVRADGSFCIIDFNDWPSFARCRDEAADAIVEMYDEMMEAHLTIGIQSVDHDYNVGTGRALSANG